MKVLVTGASGFVGSRLCRVLKERNHEVTAVCRSLQSSVLVDVADHRIAVGDIGPDTDWSQALAGQEAVFHLAARAHVMEETAADPEQLYRQVNVEGTKSLVAQAASAGVRRFLFLSSIKVSGEKTTTHPFTETMEAAPEDAYGRTKWQAEQLIRSEPGLNATIVRTPLVYGPGVKGNFRKLIKLCSRGWPLPLGAIQNKRSLIYLDNLIDALIHCLNHDQSIGHTFLVSDGEDISTPQLFKKMALALGKPSRVLPVPVSILKLAGQVTGKSGAIDRLCGSLQIDSRFINDTLSWTPPYSLQQGLDKTAIWYQNLSQTEGTSNLS